MQLSTMPSRLPAISRNVSAASTTRAGRWTGVCVRTRPCSGSSRRHAHLAVRRGPDHRGAPGRRPPAPGSSTTSGTTGSGTRAATGRRASWPGRRVGREPAAHRLRPGRAAATRRPPLATPSPVAAASRPAPVLRVGSTGTSVVPCSIGLGFASRDGTTERRRAALAARPWPAGEQDGHGTELRAGRLNRPPPRCLRAWRRPEGATPPGEVSLGSRGRSPAPAPAGRRPSRRSCSSWLGAAGRSSRRLGVPTGRRRRARRARLCHA